MTALYIFLGLIGLLLLLVLIAVIRTLATPTKSADWEPKKDPAREEEYAKKLSEMVRFETVSYKGEIQREKFLEFHKLLEELFPLVHQHLEKTENSMIFIEKDTPLSRAEVDGKIQILTDAVKANKTFIASPEIKKAIKSVVPTFVDPEDINKDAEKSEEMKMITT